MLFIRPRGGGRTMSQSSILKKLAQEYDRFTKSEKKIADYILAHPIEAQYMTISGLADAAGVADSTLSGFCRDLGCKGFMQFKLLLAQDTVAEEDAYMDPGVIYGIGQTDTVDDICKKLSHVIHRAIQETMRLTDPEAIARAVDYIEQAGQVYCCGQGGSSAQAMEAWAQFITMTNKFHWVQDNHMQAMTTALMQPGDVILYFCYSGATRDLMDVITLAKKRDVHTVLITRYPTAMVARQADVILPCGAAEGPLGGGSVPAKAVQLFLTGVLANEYSRRNRAEVGQNRVASAESIANKFF